MPATNRRYCVLGLHYADDPANPQILCMEGKVVVVDTLEMAQELVPRLGGGRIPHWDKTQEVCAFSPLLKPATCGINRISILTGYDPYDVQNGFRAKGIWSEAEGRDWKHHVIWNEVIRELLAWADEMTVRCDPLHAPFAENPVLELAA